MKVLVVGYLSISFLVGIFAERHESPWKSPPYNSESGSPSRMKRSSQCYGDLGCFSNAFPFNNSGDALPLNPRFIRTRFYLLSSINARFPTTLIRNDADRLRRSRFDGSLPTKVIIHGFEQYGLVKWTRDMAREFILKKPTNVIIVDWGHGSGWPYVQAVANTRVVGSEVAKMIEFLIAETNTDISNIHLIGHSLGAHVAGYAGEKLRGLGRITGLDPAEPNFKGTDIQVRLDPGDASFVDVIHTDGAPFDEISGYGLMDPVGHLDFYPNGGKDQPGCTKESWYRLFSQSYHSGVERTADLVACSHSRSIFLFTESIRSECPFKAYPCEDFTHFTNGECLSCGERPCPIMGLRADENESSNTKPRGKFYLTTGKSSPYCGFIYSISVSMTTSMPPAEGLLEVSLVGADGRTANHSLYRDEFRGGETYKGILISREPFTSITEVHFRFTENSKMWSWIWSDSVQVDKIAVTNGVTSETKIFCGRDVTVNSGKTITLSETSAVC